MLAPTPTFECTPAHGCEDPTGLFVVTNNGFFHFEVSGGGVVAGWGLRLMIRRWICKTWGNFVLCEKVEGRHSLLGETRTPSRWHNQDLSYFMVSKAWSLQSHVQKAASSNCKPIDSNFFWTITSELRASACTPFNRRQCALCCKVTLWFAARSSWQR